MLAEFAGTAATASPNDIDWQGWIKLLFVPTMGCCILAALIIEEQCARKQHTEQYSHKSLANNGHHHHPHHLRPSLLQRVKQFFYALLVQQSVSLLNTPNAENSFIESSSPAATAPTSLRLNLVNGDGIANCFKVQSTLPLHNIVTFYLQRLADKDSQSTSNGNGATEYVNGDDSKCNTTPPIKAQSLPSSPQSPAALALRGLSASNVVLRHQGRKLPIDESPLQLGLPDMAVIEVEPDYLSLFTAFRRQCDAHYASLARELEIERQAKQAAEDSITEHAQRTQTRQQRLQQLNAQSRIMLDDIAATTNQIAAIHADIQRVEEEILRVESSMQNVDSGESEIRNERLSLERDYQSLQSQLSSLSSELDTLRASHSEVLALRISTKAKFKDLIKELEGNEKEMSQWKARAAKLQQAKDRIERIEKVISDRASYEARIKDNENEMAKLNNEISEIQSKSPMKEEKEKELHFVKSRLKSLDRETKELAKWKSSVKGMETEVKEAQRHKLLVKQGKTREKALETQMKELHQWRQKARTIEREVKELRAWKRIKIELARANGLEGIVPEFPLEGGLLDSSGSSGGDGLSTTGSLTDSTQQRVLAAGIAAGVISASALGDSGMNGMSVNDPNSANSIAFFDILRSGMNAGNRNAGSTIEFDFDGDYHNLANSLSLNGHTHTNANNSTFLPYDTGSGSQSYGGSLLSVDHRSELLDYGALDDEMEFQQLLARVDSETLNISGSSMPFTDESNLGIISHSDDQRISSSDAASSSSFVSSFSSFIDPEERELLSASRSDKSIKASISAVRGQSWGNSSIYDSHVGQSSASSLFSSWPAAPLNPSSSPLLIIDDRNESPNGVSGGLSSAWSMSGTPSLARFNSPLVIIDDQASKSSSASSTASFERSSPVSSIASAVTQHNE